MLFSSVSASMLRRPGDSSSSTRSADNNSTINNGSTTIAPEILFQLQDEILDEDMNNYISHQRSLFVLPPKKVEKALVIRIIGFDEDGNLVYPILTEHEAHQRAFGRSGSAATQFYGCSGGDYTIVPFTHPALGNENGVLDVIVTDLPYTMHNISSVRKEAGRLLCETLGMTSGCDTEIDRKLFIMPAGLTNDDPRGFVFGAVGSDFSMYGDSKNFRVSSFSVESILHELAHGFRVSIWVSFAFRGYLSIPRSNMIMRR